MKTVGAANFRTGFILADDFRRFQKVSGLGGVGKRSNRSVADRQLCDRQSTNSNLRVVSRGCQTW
jgi:hypothetical protein